MGQNQQFFQKVITTKLSCNYLLYLPDQYGKDKQDWPLILFLHGAGERGDSLDLVKTWGPPRIVENQKDFPFIVVSPQCPEREWWSSDTQIALLDALLNNIVDQYRVDRKRIYLTGLSMGGYGTWKMAIKYPNRFAAIIPICGKGDPDSAIRIKHLPVWVCHGAKDEVVPLSDSEEMVNALKECGGNVTFTIYPDAGHNSWTETYNNPDLFKWLLKHKLKSL